MQKKVKRPAQEDGKAPRDQLQEAQAALHFWQALEYLAPQKPPDVSTQQGVWEFDPGALDAGAPWCDASKQKILKAKHAHWRFQVFCGIVDGACLIDDARAALGASAVDMEERRPPSPAACLVLEVNGQGMATGAVFVSTVPWAMARIIEYSGTSAAIDFQGFFGSEGAQAQITRRLTELLVERKLLRLAQADGATMQAPGGTVAAEKAAAVDTGAAAVAPPQAARDDELRAVTADDILALESLMFDDCGWRPEQQKRWRVKAVMESANGVKKEADDPLNSFFAEDIERVSAALAGSDVGAGLRAYLQGEQSPDHVDLERERDVLIDGVRPCRLPLGAWPSTYPQVTAQQFAVNAIASDLAEGSGIFSVNGPPGTGKTTMLKDIVAATIVRRAEAMVRFTSPAAAFAGALEIERYDYAAYQLDQALCDFGIVVASANNGAVENISKELPGMAAIDKDIDLDYFSLVADSVAAPEHQQQRMAAPGNWGLVAAVLGNKENRGNFARRFWFADGKKKAAAPGTPHTQAAPDPMRLRSIQSVIEGEAHGALPWREAQQRYRSASAKVQALLLQAEQMAQTMAELDKARQQLASHRTQLTSLLSSQPALQSAVELAEAAARHAQDDLLASRARQAANRSLLQQKDAVASIRAELAAWRAKLPSESLVSLRDSLDATERACSEIERQDETHHRRRPGLLAQIFRTAYSQRWNQTGMELKRDMAQAQAARRGTAATLALAESMTANIGGTALRETSALAQLASVQAHAAAVGIDGTQDSDTLDADLQRYSLAAAHRQQAAAQAGAAFDLRTREIAVHQGQVAREEQEIAGIEASIAAWGLDPSVLRTWSLARLEREALHRAAPFFLPALFDARRALFVAAMDLHKSFIVASWPKLRPTLSAFVNLLTGGISANQVHGGPMALWDAFFLVVPLVSTAFASFPRLFAGIGREQLAWLLIDEAGQATPQQAVGAIWRSRRTIVVGDPLQLEPVVGVPDELIAPLLARCATEPRWAPPAASAQVLADRANRYGTWLGDDERRIWLGAPLVVHRRCLEPMFSIANEISYGGLMVHDVAADDSAKWPSCWIDRPALEAEGHWVEDQAQIAVNLVHSIAQGELMSKGRHKVYVITPFRTVAERLRVLLQQRFGDQSRGMSGTVHTFQGKEADNVIFLLGGDPTRPGVISAYAGAKPNLVNVAVTRAKRRLYVVGDARYWTGPHDLHRIFNTMREHLPFHASAIREAVPGP